MKLASAPEPAAACALVRASYRKASADDALCLGVLATQVFLETYAVDGIRAALAREVRQQYSTEAVAALLALPAVAFIVAEAAGHLIAFAEVHPERSPPLGKPANRGQLRRLQALRSSLTTCCATRATSRKQCAHRVPRAVQESSRAVWRSRSRS